MTRKAFGKRVRRVGTAKQKSATMDLNNVISDIQNHSLINSITQIRSSCNYQIIGDTFRCQIKADSLPAFLVQLDKTLFPP